MLTKSEDKTVKKTPLILLVFTHPWSYGNPVLRMCAQFNKAGPATTELEDANPVPYVIPDVVINPMPLVPLYQVDYLKRPGISMSVVPGPILPLRYPHIVVWMLCYKNILTRDPEMRLISLHR